ncbi:hypothetical protein V5O48_005475 [Marasmius crinis-equi]|uniref:Cytochrome P450 n=1 Tax=Marasmius crinis-equi TaxID=585013 RepID=A0ABR3FM82_9AGAR
MSDFLSSATLDSSFVVKATFAILAAWALPKLYGRVTLYLSVRHLPGPAHPGHITGNFQESLDDDRAVVPTQWLEKYGRVMRTWGMFGSAMIHLADLKGLSHVLKHDAVIYQKPDLLAYLLGRLTGQGLFIVEGEDHRRQRKVMNPAFGPSEIRALTEIFVEKSIELRDLWTSQIENADGSKAEVDVLSWLSKMTLDVIGQAGFNYQLDALSGKFNELNKAFAHTFGSGDFLSPALILKLLFPSLRALPETDAQFRSGQATSNRVAMELYERNKIAVEKTGAPSDRDLFSLLIKSNMSPEVPAEQRMSVDEVLAQVPTFLSAGHETTSTSTTLAFYLLCANPAIQSKLREELLSVSTDSPSMDQLNALSYLDAVVRETLRLLGPVQGTTRQAMQDDVIPLSQPFVDRYGREHNVLEVKKGQEIIIPLLAINKDKSLWGEDAEEFRPERWANLPEAVNAIPGVWGNMMTFLGGPHACIGWRFTIVETKALIFTLLRAFEFELAVPTEDILIKRGFAVHRPVVRGKKGNQLPVVIKPVSSI